MRERLWSGHVQLAVWGWVATMSGGIMLGSLVMSKRYLLVGALAALTVSVVGAVLRAYRCPRGLLVLAQLAALAIWTTLAFAADKAWLGVLPSPDAAHAVWSTFQESVNLGNQYTSPLPSSRSISLTFGLGIGVLGLVIDVVGVTLRRVPLLALVFLGLYMVPLSLFAGHVSLFAFIVGAAGYIALLGADERDRVTHWGRQISDAGSMWETSDGSDISAEGLASVGRRIGFGAVAIAVVAPLLIPTLAPHYFGQSGSGGGSGGSGVVSVTNPVLDLKRNLVAPGHEVLLRFATDDTDPGYLRIAVLDDFTGTTWQPSVRRSDNSILTNRSLPPAPGEGSAIATRLVSYQLDAGSNFSSTWLPVEYAPTQISVSPSWRMDLSTMDVNSTSSSETTRGLAYSFTAAIPEPTSAQLRAAGPPPASLDTMTSLPTDLPSVIFKTAAQVTSGASNAYDKAELLQNWFRSSGGFTYSTARAPGNGIDTITHFITDDRVGYCEQFASAMAIMARTLGIPARVAVGFLRPQHDGKNWAYTADSMHAWPELYFSGVGWVRFEPTPAIRTGTAPDYAHAGGVGPSNSPSTSASPLPVHQRPTLHSPGTPAGAGSKSSGGTGTGGFLGWLLLGVALAVVVALTPLTLKTIRVRRRWARATTPAAMADAAWDHLRDGALDLRIPWRDDQTPRATGRDLRGHLTGDSDSIAALNTIVVAIEQRRYARGVRGHEDLRTKVDAVLSGLAGDMSGRYQWLAAWWPVSPSVALRQRWLRPRVRRVRESMLTVSE
ncbi:MAG: transglutaminaseTgpA domain-containing protein [Nocardioidaceae bacterium]